jgi:hypothetical protein
MERIVPGLSRSQSHLRIVLAAEEKRARRTSKKPVRRRPEGEQGEGEQVVQDLADG